MAAVAKWKKKAAFRPPSGRLRLFELDFRRSERPSGEGPLRLHDGQTVGEGGEKTVQRYRLRIVVVAAVVVRPRNRTAGAHRYAHDLERMPSRVDGAHRTLDDDLVALDRVTLLVHPRGCYGISIPVYEPADPEAVARSNRSA